MARQCCRDSVAMWVIAHDTEPFDGQRIDCRWCLDGYGRFVNDRWTYGDDLHDRIAKMAAEVESPAFQALKDGSRGK